MTEIVSQKKSELAETAFKMHKEILEMEQNIELGFWYIGERLYKIKQDELYQHLGFQSFTEYLAQPEIKSSRIAYQLLAVYKRYVIELKCEPKQLMDIGYSKLDLLKDHVDSKNLDDMIHKAKTLSRRQLEDEYKPFRKGSREQIRSTENHKNCTVSLIARNMCFHCLILMLQSLQGNGRNIAYLIL